MSINCSQVTNFNNSLEHFNSVKTLCDDLVKYIRTYKQTALDFSKKLSGLQNSFTKKLSKSEKNSMSQITFLTSKLIELLNENISLLKLSTDELESRCKTFESELKNKNDSIKVIQKKTNEQNKILINSYNEINKAKKNYLDSMAKTEEIINKYYSNKKIIEEHDIGLGKKLNINDYNLLKEKLKTELYEMNNSIKTSKNYESTYQNLITESFKIHDNFDANYKIYNTKMKEFNISLAVDIKNLLLSFFLTYKNSFRQPMVSTDVNINSLNNTDEEKETEKILKDMEKNDNLLQNVTPINYNLKSIVILKENKFFDNDININSAQEELENNDVSERKRSNSISKLEDGFTQLQYISDSSLYMTIKTAFENFKLVSKDDLNMELEEIKFKTQQYILKIEGNMNSYPYAKNGYQNSKINDDNLTILYTRNDLTEEENTELTKLLDHHESRLIFLQKLSDYRARGKFYLDQKDYDILLKYFNIIADKIKDNMDYHCAEMVIIISQTYFLEVKNKKNEKKYIQDELKKNKLFQDKNFWQEFLCFAINKEIMKTQRRDKKLVENKTSSDNKLSNVVFSQLLTLIDNMVEFGLDAESVKEIIEPKIIYYKLNEALKITINDVLNSKIEGEKQKKIELEKQLKEKEKEINKEEEKQNNEEIKNEKEDKNKEEKKEEVEIKKDDIKEDKKEEETKKEEEIKKDDIKEEKKEGEIKNDGDNKNE